MIACVDRRYIGYQPPFHVETFKSGVSIGCDAGGANCVRIEGAPPGAVFIADAALAAAACAALNEQPISPLMRAEFAWPAGSHTAGGSNVQGAKSPNKPKFSNETNTTARGTRHG